MIFCIHKIGFMPDYSQEIAAIEAILNAGTSSVSIDGMSASYNFEQLRKRLAELKALDDATVSASKVRPRNAKIKLNFF